MRWRLQLLSLVGALALLAPPAKADLAEGDAAPEFEGTEFVNIEPCSFKSLRGHAVLVEIFRTW